MRRNFRLVAAAQVVLLVVTTAVGAAVVVTSSHVAVPLLLLLVIAVEMLVLFGYVTRHVRDLEEFFAAVTHGDFARQYIEDDLDAELKAAFNLVLDRFRTARADYEAQANYLDVVVRHVPIALLLVRRDGRLRLANPPARRLFGVARLTHIDDLSRVAQGLPAQLAALAAGTTTLVQTRIGGLASELRVGVSEIRLEGESERLYSLENLAGELSARESSAWRNLIRVLTHEIMNTLTPVTSLARSAADLVESDADGDLADALDTIARRSEGLMDFVARYREVLQVPQPALDDVAVRDLIDGALALMRDDLGETRVSIEVDPPALYVRVDPNLLNQVLVNLLRNALAATVETTAPEIAVHAALVRGRVIVRIRDNGCGMDDATADQAFVPFYTTKRDGSGIGLSVSRQIVSAHGGELDFTSEPGAGSEFLIVL